MRKEMFDSNLLVSCSWGVYGKAKEEIIYILEMLGDESPLVKRTIAEGIIGVRTRLNPREVVYGLRKLFDEDPSIFQYTLKWVPVDLWTFSDMDCMKEGIRKIRNRIQPGERWRMTVEKRRYSLHHKSEIIKVLADLIDEKVNLQKPEKILRLDIIGRYAGMSVLKPIDIFSIAKHREGKPLA